MRKRCPSGTHRKNNKCVNTYEYEGLYLSKEDGKLHWFGDYSESSLHEADRTMERLKEEGIKSGVFNKSLSDAEIMRIVSEAEDYNIGEIVR